MIDFFLNLVKVNESVDYAMLISILVSYFFIIWFVICLWVFNDARKRYDRFITSFLFTFFVLLFGPPALIFYILVRPEHTLEEDYLINLALSGEKEMKPIYFDGENGFDISINLSVQPKESANDKHKMNMSIDWMPQRKGVEKVPVKQREVTEDRPSILDRIRDVLSKFTANVRGASSRVSTSLKERGEKKEKAEMKVEPKVVKEEPSQNNKNKNKKKKRKKKKKKK